MKLLKTIQWATLLITATIALTGLFILFGDGLDHLTLTLGAYLFYKAIGALMTLGGYAIGKIAYHNAMLPKFIYTLDKEY